MAGATLGEWSGSSGIFGDGELKAIRQDLRLLAKCSALFWMPRPSDSVLPKRFHLLHAKLPLSCIGLIPPSVLHAFFVLLHRSATLFVHRLPVERIVLRLPLT